MVTIMSVIQVYLLREKNSLQFLHDYSYSVAREYFSPVLLSSISIPCIAPVYCGYINIILDISDVMKGEESYQITTLPSLGF